MYSPLAKAVIKARAGMYHMTHITPSFGPRPRLIPRQRESLTDRGDVVEHGQAHDVERILNHHVVHDALGQPIVHFLVSWTDDDIEECTWEPMCNLEDCDVLIRSYVMMSVVLQEASQASQASNEPETLRVSRLSHETQGTQQGTRGAQGTSGNQETQETQETRKPHEENPMSPFPSFSSDELDDICMDEDEHGGHHPHDVCSLAYVDQPLNKVSGVSDAAADDSMDFLATHEHDLLCGLALSLDMD